MKEAGDPSGDFFRAWRLFRLRHHRRQCPYGPALDKGWLGKMVPGPWGKSNNATYAGLSLLTLPKNALKPGVPFMDNQVCVKSICILCDPVSPSNPTRSSRIDGRAKREHFARCRFDGGNVDLFHFSSAPRTRAWRPRGRDRRSRPAHSRVDLPDKPHFVLHHPQALSVPPLLTIASRIADPPALVVVTT